MGRTARVFASALALTLALSACGGHSSPLPTTFSNSSNAGTQSAARTATASSTPLISIPKTYGPLAYTDLGRRASSAPVSVTITLRYNHQSELEQFLAGLGPGHNFLTPAQFNGYYAPTVQQEQSVVSALQKAGFTIAHRYPNRTIVDATAPSSIVERFFSTEMHTVRQGKYGQRFANLKPATVPASIARYVRDASLSNVVIARTVVDQEAGAIDNGKPRHTPKPSPSPSPTNSPTPTPSPTTSSTATPVAACNGATADNGPLTNSYGTLATGVAKPFDFPVQHGCNGAGYTAAIVIDDPVNTSYVATYLTASGITQTGTITNEAVDGGGSGEDAETDLDVQTISGLAPGANIIVYDEGTLADQNIEDAYNQVLSDGKASAVNSSFGGCESSDTSFVDSTNAIAEQGASEGVEFSASSGDSGSNECSLLGIIAVEGVLTPAGDPYFTSVGGINFTDNSSGVLTSVTAGSIDGYAGGGGVSTVVPLPSWQSGIAGVITSGRNQPDVSLPFDVVAVYTNGAWGSYLGTSWSSPASVALFIEADELHGSKLGWLNPTLYSLFKSTGYNSYYTPCTSGSNGAYSCNASEYNQAAGIGAPKGWALANAL
jgi:subtilase family serine protease